MSRYHAIAKVFSFADHKSLREIQEDEMAAQDLNLEADALNWEAADAKRQLQIAAGDHASSKEWADIHMDEVITAHVQGEMIRSEYGKPIPRGGFFRSWSGCAHIRRLAQRRVAALRERVRFLGRNMANSISEHRRRAIEREKRWGIDPQEPQRLKGGRIGEIPVPDRFKTYSVEGELFKQQLLREQEERERQLSEPQVLQEPERQKQKSQKLNREDWACEPTERQIKILKENGYRVPKTKAEAFILIHDNGLSPLDDRMTEEDREVQILFVRGVSAEEQQKRKQNRKQKQEQQVGKVSTDSKEKNKDREGEKQDTRKALQLKKESWLCPPTDDQRTVLESNGYRVPTTKAEAYLMIHDNKLASPKNDGAPEEREQMISQLRMITREEKERRNREDSRQPGRQQTQYARR